SRDGAASDLEIRVRDQGVRPMSPQPSSASETNTSSVPTTSAAMRAPAQPERLGVESAIDGAFGATWGSLDMERA
ncbi:MAG TPA: hypothetical protein VIU16_15880, partial [Gaiellaceae bacterium]